MISNRICFFNSKRIFNLSNVKHSSQCSVKLTDQVSQDIEKQKYKPRRHPGVVKTPENILPENVIKAISNVAQDFPIKSVIQGSKKLNTFLYHRHVPLERDEVREKTKEVENIILNEYYSKEQNTDLPKKNILDKYHNKYTKLIKTKIQEWIPIKYDTYTALQYLFGRSAQEYAVLVRIFAELIKKYPDFKPRTFFDFGSGVGTGTWAVSLFWSKTLYEYFSVDISPEMNDLADVLLKNGFANKPSNLRGVFRRQFLPALNTQYDIVLSAYSLLELSSSQNRLEVVSNLWNKTSNFLIVVEQGNSAGFKIVNEVRDFILDIKDGNNLGHVIMPCPHDAPCPRYLNDYTPCNFEVKYQELPFSGSEIKRERYAYVVLKKGKRDSTTINWPRIVRPPLVRSKHTICRLCTQDGKLQEIIFTAAKHGKTAYHCARSSSWGDSLPIEIEKDLSEPDT